MKSTEGTSHWLLDNTSGWGNELIWDAKKRYTQICHTRYLKRKHTLWYTGRKDRSHYLKAIWLSLNILFIFVMQYFNRPGWKQEFLQNVIVEVVVRPHWWNWTSNVTGSRHYNEHQHNWCYRKSNVIRSASETLWINVCSTIWWWINEARKTMGFRFSASVPRHFLNDFGLLSGIANTTL